MMMMAPRGEPWQIMYTNVTNVLVRATFLHRYPFTIAETFAGLLPAEVGAKQYQWRNLERAIRWEHWSQFEVDARGDKVLFWVRDPTMVQHPTPLSADTGFDLDPGHPNWHEIVRWATEASELDDWIENACMYLNRVLKTMKHPTWVERFWPEIVPYVGTLPEVLVKGMREPRPTSMHLDPALQDEIQNKLTMCALLPKDTEQLAWVGRYMS